MFRELDKEHPRMRQIAKEIVSVDLAAFRAKASPRARCRNMEPLVCERRASTIPRAGAASLGAIPEVEEDRRN